MLTEHEKFSFTDKAGKHKLFAEVNWSEDAKMNECKVVKFTLEGKEVYVPKKELLEVMLAIGNVSEKAKMIPQKLTKVRWYETVVSVKSQKDIRKGELITFPIKLSLPALEEEVIGELKKSQTKTNIPLIGNH